MVQPTAARIWAGVIIASAAVLYGLTAGRFAVGAANDDAEYVLAARFLARARFSPAALFDGEGLRERQPGFPMLLAPFAAAAQPPFTGLRLIPLLLSLLSCGLFWLELRDRAPPSVGLLLLALFAFNPGVVAYSGKLMSESLFVAQTLLGFVLLRQVAERGGAARSCVLALVLSWAALTRGEGIALIAAAALALVYEKRWRELAVCLAIPALVLALYHAGDALLRRAPGFYADFWMKTWPALAATSGFGLRHLARMVRMLVLDCALACPAEGLIGDLLVLSGIILLGRGLLSLGRPPRRPAGRDVGLAAFFCAYGALHAIWPVADPRFFLVLLPWVLVLAWEGLRDALAAPWRRGVALAACGLVLCGYARHDAFALRQARQPPLANRLPALSLEWVRRSAPADARFWTILASPMITLHTGRPAVRFVPPADVEVLIGKLRRMKVDFVFHEPLRAAFDPLAAAAGPAAAWAAFPDAARRHPGAFRLIYSEPREAVLIFQVLPDSSGEAAGVPRRRPARPGAS